MKIRFGYIFGLLAGLVSLSPSAAIAGSYANDFSSSVGAAVTNGNASFVAGQLQLTPNASSQYGTLLINDTDPGVALQSFTATFDLTIDGHGLQGADGFSFNFANPASYPSGSSSFENGAGSGLNFRFATYVVNATTIGINSSGIASSTTYGNSVMTDGAKQPVSIVYDRAVGASLTYRGKTISVTAAQLSGFVPQSGFKFLFGARCGGSTENHIIDNVMITTVPMSANANLANLTSSTGPLIPDFSADTTNYTLNVAYDVTNFNVVPTVAQSNATLKVNGSAVASGSASGNMALNVGNNAVTIVVTAENGATKTYAIAIARSGNADLAALSLSAGILAPEFDNAQTEYDSRVANAISNITVTPTAFASNSSITVNGIGVATGTASGNIALDAGVNVVTIVVSNSFGAVSQLYHVFVTRMTLPVISIVRITGITGTRARIGTALVSNGGDPYVTLGVVMAPTAINANPEIGGPGVTPFIGVPFPNVLGLTPGTSYSVKAYASNSEGINYSGVAGFVTASNFNTTLVTDPTQDTDSIPYEDFYGWTASPNVAWLHGGNGGNSKVFFSHDANLGATRTGILTVNGESFTIIQPGTNYVRAGAMIIASEGVSSPDGLTLDGAGNIYFTDQGSWGIKKWIAASNSVVTITPSFSPTAAGLILDNAGNIIVADRYNGQVAKFGADGTFLNYVTPPGYGPSGYGWVRGPNSFAHKVGSQFYVNDYVEGAIKILDTAVINEPLPYLSSNSVTPLETPYSLTVDSGGALYIVDIGNSKATNRSVKRFPAFDGGPGFTAIMPPVVNSAPMSVSIDGDNNVYALWYHNSLGFQIKKWRASDQTVSIIGTYPNGSWRNIAVDAGGNIFLTSSLNSLQFIPQAYVDPSAQTLAGDAGHGSLLPVLARDPDFLTRWPATSDQSWLTITGVTNGVVSYAFDANWTTDSRTAHINVAGYNIALTQEVSALPPPPLITSQSLVNGAFQFTYSNAGGIAFTVLTSTNLSLPSTNWTVLGVATNVSGNLYQFTDPATKDFKRRFYQLRFP